MDSKEKQSKFTTNLFFNLIISSKIDTVSQGDILDRLSCVYKLGDNNTRPSKETLSTYATNFKKGEKPLTKFFGFDNLILNNKFKDDIKSDHPKSLTIMKDFVDEIIDQEQYTDLVKCILMFIDNDDTIKDEDDFYLFEIKTFVHKRDLCSLKNYYIDSFLLSVWYYLVEHCNAYTNKNAFLHYFEKNDALRSINNIKREINVDRYSENNRELADEYSKLKQNADAVEKKSDKADKNSDIKHKENVLNVNTKYLVQNDKFNSSADSDFDRLCDFRDDYNKMLEFIIELDFNNVRFKDFLRYSFHEFELKVYALAQKWDFGNRFIEVKNEELTDSIKQELKNYVDIINISNGADTTALIPIKNRLSGYYRKLNFGVMTFDNLNNN